MLLLFNQQSQQALAPSLLLLWFGEGEAPTPPPPQEGQSLAPSLLLLWFGEGEAPPPPPEVPVVTPVFWDVMAMQPQSYGKKHKKQDLEIMLLLLG